MKLSFVMQSRMKAKLEADEGKASDAVVKASEYHPKNVLVVNAVPAEL